MKKFWKFLGITALAATLIPYRVKKDEVTGEKSYDALLWHARTRDCTSDGTGGRKVDVTFGLKTPEEKDWVDFDDVRNFQWEDDELEMVDVVEIDDEDLADLDTEIPEG